MPVRRSSQQLWQTALLAAAISLAGGLVVAGHRADCAALFYGGLLGMAAATGPAAFALGRGRWPDGVLVTGICVASANFVNSPAAPLVMMPPPQ